jgi:hypothetical protein
MTDDNEREATLNGYKAEAFVEQNFQIIMVDAESRKILWRDPVTGQFWRETFSPGEMQAPGPPEYVRITEEEARAEFGTGRVL